MIPISAAPEQFVGVCEGKCLEGKGISDGDYVIIDKARRPGVGDVCLCICPYENRGEPMLKEYLGKSGNAFVVGTRYKEPTSGFQGAYFATKILGTVVRVLTSKREMDGDGKPDLEIKGEITFAQCFAEAGGK